MINEYAILWSAQNAAWIAFRSGGVVEGCAGPDHSPQRVPPLCLDHCVTVQWGGKTRSKTKIKQRSMGKRFRRLFPHAAVDDRKRIERLGGGAIRINQNWN